VRARLRASRATIRRTSAHFGPGLTRTNGRSEIAARRRDSA
jgi:hypothetical protein